MCVCDHFMSKLKFKLQLKVLYVTFLKNELLCIAMISMQRIQSDVYAPLQCQQCATLANRSL